MGFTKYYISIHIMGDILNREKEERGGYLKNVNNGKLEKMRA
jgi:hypothetical protein